MRQHSMSLRKKLALSALIATAFAVPREVQAAAITWANLGTAWATGTNWVGGTAPANSLTTDTVVFDTTGSYTFQPNAGTTSIAGITIGANSATGLNISGTALSIGAAGVTMNSGAGTATISSPVTLGAAPIVDE